MNDKAFSRQMTAELVHKDRIIAFDVETPNFHNDRMSAIGIAVIENGGVTTSYTSIINPETHFDSFNVSLTGITPKMASRSPTFPQIWCEIGSLMQSGILIAHNAAFDMRVLANCLKSYKIEIPRYVQYACTVQMGRSCYPELPNHRLDTLCRYRDIPLDHHKADSDSVACANLYLDYLANGLQIQTFLRTYDLQDIRTLRKQSRPATPSGGKQI